ncbi:hypothetical protein R50072_09740 [Simiduia litorea]
MASIRIPPALLGTLASNWICWLSEGMGVWYLQRLCLNGRLVYALRLKNPSALWGVAGFQQLKVSI